MSEPGFDLAVNTAESGPTIVMWPHYKVIPLESFEQVREHFSPTTDYTLNWLILSTSGVHGTYTTLDEIEDCDGLDEYGDTCPTDVTVLIVCPRLVVMKYGHFEVTEDDIRWLRDQVAKTLDGITRSQYGNLPNTEDAE